jgi:hypothetical protein
LLCAQVCELEAQLGEAEEEAAARLAEQEQQLAAMVGPRDKSSLRCLAE